MAGIETVRTLQDLGADLLRELATHHSSLRTPSGDSNRSRWPHHPLWQAVLRDIEAMDQFGLIRSVDPRSNLEWRLHHQAKSLYGSLKGVGALLAIRDGEEPSGRLSRVLGALPELLEGHHAEPELRAELERRITAYRLGQW